MRWSRLLVVFAYVVPLAVAVLLLLTIGDWLLAVLLVCAEVVVVSLVTYAQRTATPTPEVLSGPRLGTPRDPGRASGRRPPRRYAAPPQPRPAARKQPPPAGE